MRCNKCGTPLPRETRICTHCGSAVAPRKRKPNYRIPLLIAVVILMLALLIGITVLCIRLFSDISSPTPDQIQVSEVPSYTIAPNEPEAPAVPETEAPTVPETEAPTVPETQPPAPTFSADNPYRIYFDVDDPYIIADSNSRVLTESDLQGMTEEALCLARNEIYARHGYSFKSENLQEYFQQCPWYTPAASNNSIKLNSTEQKNVSVISACEEKQSRSASQPDRTLNISLETDFYTLYLPAYWEDNCVWQEELSESGVHRLTFYEQHSLDDQCGGLLFGIWLYPSVDENSLPPNYRELKSFTDSDGTQWTAIVYYPSDVQFSLNNMELYQQMCADESAILDSIRWK